MNYLGPVLKLAAPFIAETIGNVGKRLITTIGNMACEKIHTVGNEGVQRVTDKVAKYGFNR